MSSTGKRKSKRNSPSFTAFATHNPSLMKLFGAIVLDAWKEKQALIFVQRPAATESNLEKLNQRKDDLDEVFMF